MPSDSDWDWDVEYETRHTITVYEEEIEETIHELYDADGNVIRRFTNSTRQPMGFALTPVKGNKHATRKKNRK